MSLKLLRVSILFGTIVMISCSSVTCPDLVSRSSWGAEKPKRTKYMRIPIPRVFIHHTQGDSCSSESTCSEIISDFQKKHKKFGWFDVAWHFLIGGDGKIYVGRGWFNQGSSVKNYNTNSISIAFIGKYNRKKPSPRMLSAAKKLIRCGVGKNYLASNYTLHGHRQASSCTKCPGTALFNEIKKWKNYQSDTLSKSLCDSAEEDANEEEVD